MQPLVQSSGFKGASGHQQHPAAPMHQEERDQLREQGSSGEGDQSQTQPGERQAGPGTWEDVSP